MNMSRGSVARNNPNGMAGGAMSVSGTGSSKVGGQIQDQRALRAS
jgi:hypothetical protein